MSTPTSDMKSPEVKPQIKIGHYILKDTLGVGTFGKVKESTGNWVMAMWFLCSCGRMMRFASSQKHQAGYSKGNNGVNAMAPEALTIAISHPNVSTFVPGCVLGIVFRCAFANLWKKLQGYPKMRL
ncbi:hypothetical protein NECAME_10735 [Necator americanus]|uniref:Protein kinase domain-containing protein n=1 Tax=Necator americanus TaxID=51031 RepID=W2T7R2_NECAM|nr:hypothetical protein NECAME_10735 [Necator americanus]ETN77903.1 hypothetical protein NECAME_10735 [Necator americanus]